MLKEKLELDESFEPQLDPTRWPELKDKLAVIFKTKTRDQWCELLEGTDACFAPILSMTEAPKHPHNVARKSFIEVNGEIQPGPAPKFSRTVPTVQAGAPRPGSDTEDVLSSVAGYDSETLAALRAAGVLS